MKNIIKIISIGLMLVWTPMFAQQGQQGFNYHSLFQPGSSFEPSAGNSLRTTGQGGCSLSCSGASEYYIRTGILGYDETADAIPTFTEDIQWTVVEDDCGLIDEPRHPVVYPYPGDFGDMGVIMGDPSGGVKLISPGHAATPGGIFTSPCLTNGPHYYKLQTKFCVSEDATGLSMNLSCLADNNVEIYLNEVYLGGQGGTDFGWYTENRLDISVSGAPINIGENTLTVVLHDQSALLVTGFALYAEMFATTGCIGCCGQNSMVSGYKYEDINGNGLYELGEPPMEGVQFDLTGGGETYTAYTDASGYFVFTDVPAVTTYDLVEVVPDGYTNTFPGTGSYTGISTGLLGTHFNYLFLNAEDLAPTGPCVDCGNSFQPLEGERYWISAWINVDYPEQVITYDEGLSGGFLRGSFLGTSAVIPEFLPTGEIIDGWQRVVGMFTVPSGATNFLLSLNAHPEYDTYFDDIRIHPFNASMKSFVYDGETFWLLSELDDNNYATFYEYDEEGGLIRIKKETERGVVTIQETRSNSVITNPNTP